MNLSTVNVARECVRGNEYGGFTNRVKHSWDTTKNTTATTLKGTAVVGATAGTCALFARSSSSAVAKMIAAIAKIPDSVAKVLAKITPKANGLVTKLEKLPAKYKAMGTIAALGFGLFAAVRNKFLYNQGKIDQKYQDRATVQETFDIIK